MVCPELHGGSRLPRFFNHIDLQLLPVIKNALHSGMAPGI